MVFFFVVVFCFVFGALALRAVAVCCNAVLSYHHRGGADHVNISPGLSCCRPLPLQQRNKFEASLCFWNDVFFSSLVLKYTQSLIRVARLSVFLFMYVQMFRFPEGHLQRRVQRPRHRPPSLEKISIVPRKDGGE